jgi:subtilisin family serine protease
MRRSTLLLAIVAALGCCLPFSAQADAGAQAGRYIVVLKDAVDSNGVADLHAARYGVQLGHVYSYAIHGYSAVIRSERLDALRADPNVAFVSQDGDVAATAQTVPTGINRIDAELSTRYAADNSGAPAVAVIDTGIDASHPELNVKGGVNCSNGRPGNFQDGNGHGTHVSGTIAARNNTDGVVGVLPGAPLYAVRVLNNNGSGSWSDVICGVDWVKAHAAQYGIKVASMSLGGSGSDGSCSSDALHQAICNAAGSVSFVVAAGNGNANFSASVPAAYDQVITVTAIADFNGLPGGGAPATCRSDVDDTPADFSNYTTSASGDASHTIAAPGVCIVSTWKGGGYNTISGTSMATPHVSGTVALCIARGVCTPGASPATTINNIDNGPSGYGYAGVSGRYYGNLVYAGGF